MTTPFVTNIREAKAPGASKRSESYLRDLSMDKAAHLGETKSEAEAKYDAWIEKGWPSQKTVSEAINRLKAEGYTGRRYQFADQPAQPSNDLEDGFYEVPGVGVDEPAFRIIKVVHAVHGNGNQYGKELNVGTGKFEYVSGLVKAVRERGTKLSLDRARELGQLYGMCIRCGATLTDEDSIAAGIGPVCATKF